MAHIMTVEEAAQVHSVQSRPPLVSIPAPLTRTRAELRAARLAALREQIREIEETWEVTPAGHDALSLPDSTGSC